MAEEEPLSGGNTHAAIVRLGDTVRRPAGYWTPAVHQVLAHLEARGVAAPRALGIDDQGREILSFIEGAVIWPDHVDQVSGDEALESVGRSIRRLHDALTDFPLGDQLWGTRAADPSGSSELLCHNDLGPWNLIHAQDDWVYFDWDLCAPGRRSWDLSLALITTAGLMSDSGDDVSAILARIRAFVRGYGLDAFPSDSLEVAIERCGIEAAMIESDAAAGDPVAQRLLAEGHVETWRAAEQYIARNRTAWQAALRRPRRSRDPRRSRHDGETRAITPTQ